MFQGFDRAQHTTALGLHCPIIFPWQNTDTVMSSCARTLYGQQTLRAHGMPQAALQLVFRSIALAKLLYAVPAWWGFTNAGDRNRLEGFLRRAQKAGYYNNDSLLTVAAHNFTDLWFKFHNLFRECPIGGVSMYCY